MVDLPATASHVWLPRGTVCRLVGFGWLFYCCVPYRKAG